MATWQDRLDRDEVLVIDGATGTELERRGVPMNLASWSGLAVHTHPEVVREVHAAYIDVGAEVIVTNTFGTTRFVLETAGVGDEFEAINRRAVQLAMEARDASGRDVAIAGSISNLPPDMDPGNYPSPEEEFQGLREAGRAARRLRRGSHRARDAAGHAPCGPCHGGGAGDGPARCGWG